jgi:hypothetical protein
MPIVNFNDVVFTVHPVVNNKKLAETLQVKILNGGASLR